MLNQTLSKEEQKILSTLKKEGPLSRDNISDFIPCFSSSIREEIDRLEEEGLISCCGVDGYDCAVYVITDKGREAA